MLTDSAADRRKFYRSGEQSDIDVRSRYRALPEQLRGYWLGPVRDGMGYCALRTARKVATESLALPQRHSSLHSFIAIFPISPSQRQCILFLSSELWSWFSSVFSIDSEHNVM